MAPSAQDILEPLAQEILEPLEGRSTRSRNHAAPVEGREPLAGSEPGDAIGAIDFLPLELLVSVEGRASLASASPVQEAVAKIEPGAGRHALGAIEILAFEPLTWEEGRALGGARSDEEEGSELAQSERSEGKGAAMAPSAKQILEPLDAAPRRHGVPEVVQEALALGRDRAAAGDEAWTRNPKPNPKPGTRNPEPEI